MEVKAAGRGRSIAVEAGTHSARQDDMSNEIPAPDRAVELAEWLANNPWVDEGTRGVCRALLHTWAKTDKRNAQKTAERES